MDRIREDCASGGSGSPRAFHSADTEEVSSPAGALDTAAEHGGEPVGTEEGVETLIPGIGYMDRADMLSGRSSIEDVRRLQEELGGSSSRAVARSSGASAVPEGSNDKEEESLYS